MTSPKPRIPTNKVFSPNTDSHNVLVITTHTEERIGVLAVGISPNEVTFMDDGVVDIEVMSPQKFINWYCHFAPLVGEVVSFAVTYKEASHGA